MYRPATEAYHCILTTSSRWFYWTPINSLNVLKKAVSIEAIGATNSLSISEKVFGREENVAFSIRSSPFLVFFHQLCPFLLTIRTSLTV